MYREEPCFRSARIALLAAGLILPIACGGDSSGPATPDVVLAAAAGDRQFGEPGAPLADSFAVLVTDAESGRPRDAVTVRWRISAGSGATLTAATSVTDGDGIARTLLRLGADTDSVTVEADADRRRGDVARFHARAVPAPVLTSIAPLPIPAGGTVTIEGGNFSSRADDHTVLFGGHRGVVRSADPTSLTVDVPSCLPERDVTVEVRLGAVASNVLETPVAGALPAPLALQPGELRTFDDDASLSCLTFQGSDQVHLIVLLNRDPGPGAAMPWQLTGLAAQPLVANEHEPPRHRDRSLEWEMNLRALERALPPGQPPSALRPQAARQERLPEVGDRSEFNVLNRQNRTDRITAEVRAVSNHAIVYVDLDAPPGGLSQAELDGFAAMFDDPIHPTNVATFGQPSDIDGNGRIIILLTPRVNALTPPGEGSFIAGYFYGCDLVERNRCEQTNRAEIFYSMVPDPEGEFGFPRSRQTVLATVPGVLAHEFQHMIAFGRGGRLDLLWLSEGLAHMAEELVGREFAARGDTIIASDFRRPNYQRARSWLVAPWLTSLTGEDAPGTLELRGAAWLLILYLTEQYGGDALLRQLTGAAELGAQNIAARTGRSWSDVLTEFAIALWAHDAPELSGADLDPRLTFGDFPLRFTLAPTIGSYPLRPNGIVPVDFTAIGSLPPATFRHLLLESHLSAEPFTLGFTDRWGGPFRWGSPALTVLRVR